MLTEIDYHGWKSLKLTSGAASVVMPLEIGPRVVACSLEGGPNLFHNVQEELGGKGEPDWHLRGGHRLWHSPEAHPRTYDPDNVPVIPRAKGERAVTLEAPKADPAGMHKTITVEALGDESFRLTHTLRNDGLWPVQCAPWGLTVMERGGALALPLLPKGSHETNLLPNYSVVPWTYTDFSLPCWKFHRDFIRIETLENVVPQKLGITNYPGWSAYWQEGGTFIKHAFVEEGATYPDFGCCYETFCNDFMLEMETLAPLATLEPGHSVTHVEHWLIKAGLPKPDTDEAFAKGVSATATDWIAKLGR